eukprot:TRINITY_DN80788_c0_g1_i1.p1 TRINITY_DN80788_c0_g1~~TRINITY_DN80788_c0_g1_i1.p1  ORF type:complete len:500 (+),score=77.18 TRINITY_DN80788_c0_g1_i1:64-1500(+)
MTSFALSSEQVINATVGSEHQVEENGHVLNECLAAAGVVALGLLLYCMNSKSEDDRADGRRRLLSSRPQLIDYLQRARVRERFADIRMRMLFLNRPWKPRERGQNAEAIEMPELSPNEEWIGMYPFPCGETKTKDMWSMTFAVWRFCFQKYRYVSCKCIVLKIIAGVLPPLISRLFGKIVDEMNPHGSAKHLSWLCLLFLVATFLQGRANFIYNVNVPGAGLRHELRQRLQREFLQMDGAALKHWPAGKCQVCLKTDVLKFTSLHWLSFFQVWYLIFGLCACAHVFLQTNSDKLTFWPSLVIFFTLVFSSWGMTSARQENGQQLMNMRRDWEYIWHEVANDQLTKHRLGHDLDAEEMADQLGQAAMIYRKRDFHLFFFNISTTMLSQELTLASSTLLALVAGLDVQRGALTVGDATALVSVARQLSTYLDSLVQFRTNLQEGYSSLYNISKVFNWRSIPDFEEDSPNMPIGQWFDEIA